MKDFTQDNRKFQAAGGSGAGGGGGGGSFSTSFRDISEGIFGKDVAGTEQTEGTTRETFKVDEAGVLKYIEDILSGTGGLADIFAAEGEAGIYESSVAKSGTEDLLTKIAGEIAKLTGTKVTETEGTATKAQEEEGLAGNLRGIEKKIPIVQGIKSIGGF